MKVFKELIISGSRENLDRVLSEIDAAIASQGAGQWTREEERERGMAPNVRCYQFSPGSTEGQSARLWIARTNDKLNVSNIVPVATRSLGMDGYNQILTEFYEHFVRIPAEKIGASAVLTSGDQTLQDWTEGNVGDCLRSFSSAANKTTGSGHPSDKERWHRFLVASHRSARPLESHLLKRWLIEDAGWPEETAIDLVIEYEQGLDLLSYYDNQR